MKFNKGQIVTHKENPRWSAIIIADLHPRRHVNGYVRLRTTNPISATNSRGENLGRGYLMDFPKELLKIKV